MTSLLRNKAFLLSLLIVVGLAFEFWTGSRYPALDQKAMMAGTAGLEPLGFDTVLVITDDDPTYMRVLKGTVNWGKTNQRGMTFGILFAAALLTMISLFKRKSFEGSIANSALGVLIGTPLGVCVNCAAPIAKGLHSSGLRLETTLAAMISSPTLNVIVLAMVFSLFPFYMAAMKVGATLVFLLLLIPLMSKYLFKEEVSLTAQRAIAGASGNEDPKFMALDAPVPEDEEIATWPKAFIWTLKAFPRNLWFIIRTTLPLMVLAGFLGSLAVTVVPMDTLASLFPSGSILMILAGLAIASLIGVFMPVPITFDVIIVSVLMATGMPVMYAMTLLFTLGIYSVYSYMIVAQAISRKVGVTIWLAIAALGVVTGLIAREYDQRLTAMQNTFLLESWAKLDSLVEYRAPLAPAGEAAAAMLPGLQADALVPEPANAIAASGIDVALTPLAPPAAGDGKMFRRMAGVELGIEQPYQFSLLRWSQPFSEFGGIASGDVHNDGWVDVVVTSQSGAYLYANTGGQFVQQELDIPGLHDEFVANAALVDIDNDGWLDLFYSTYRNGTYLVYNDRGAFRDENRVRLPNHEQAWVSAAMGFGDIDEDGRLDIVLGNWTLGSALSRKFLGRDTSRNVVLLNRSTGFEARELPGPDGETLTVLLSDWNGDGHLDLIVGNDFAVPDLYYLGDGAGNMQLVQADDEIIPVTALLTMSATTADINNDLKPEIYIGNVSGTDHSTMSRIPDMCVDTEGTTIHEQCLEVRANQELMNTSLSGNDPLMCVDFGDAELAEQCIGMHLNLKSWWKNDPASCHMLQGKFPALSDICEEYFREELQPVKGAFIPLIPQGARRANVLLVPGADGKFVDQALELNLREAGWVWNAKFADLDHDEYQDIYIVNGYFNETTQPARESNHLFRNNAGQGFVDVTDAADMQMFAESAAYTYIDFDNDGDLDVITREVLGPVWIYRNNNNAGNSIEISLDDAVGNRSGIGSKVTIHYGDAAQVREIQASGGFSSFDAPMAHFGLGASEAVDRVEISWSTGGITELRGEFKAGHHYRISRP
ncbi:MAG: FG-GAP-like repeat-containing protein [Gammaproteobacteria bacterium]|jgi:uncharacterized membrane protein YraQ (UPF0718 family)|nr:FG-GAP-like repeat-containing protein [Gammaproteobacteria bacterium]MDP6615665.1 FG-GAP-like repeat-containing protein [Gammaproteobacteria bacterium]MDP6694692.1 FG-GAP-like repeat-containing protein [Gammaproteobacteria bacterium]MDP7041013.1 FG-GAP-like repeat-containing protein [Gammaproteobacteria bacterium]